MDTRPFKRDSAAPESRDDERLLEDVALAREALMGEFSRRIVGQQDMLEQLLVALFAGGHALLVGAPGLAKTLVVKTLAESLSLDYGRVQFTPDLMPSDITGTDVLEGGGDGRRQFRFVKGPIFCNLLLADEINRTPPKTQAALLESMQEQTVTAGGRSYALERPFVVFATQNPIEQSGTYPLPEAMLDRFMLQIDITYPSREDEIEIVRRTTVGSVPSVRKVLTRDRVVALQGLVPRVPVADHVLEYAVQIVRQTRPDDPTSPPEVKRHVSWGAGPRATQMLVLAAKARALIKGRYAVQQEDISALAPAVLRHRIVSSFEAEAEGVRAHDLIRQLVAIAGR